MLRLFTGCIVVAAIACGKPPRGDDTEGRFGALKHHGEALGFHNPEGEGAPDPSNRHHYQGIVRRPGPGVPTFYITQNHPRGGYLHVVELATRPQTQERLRSNLQALGTDTAETPPPRRDTWLQAIRFDGTRAFGGVSVPAYQHPGGPAVADDVLIVPVDDPLERRAPRGQLLLFELATDGGPPRPLRALRLNHRIDHVAITRHAAGHWLLWTNGDGGTTTRFYKTSTPDLRAPDLDLSLLQIWDRDRDRDGGEWPTGASAHQSATFIRKDDGTLYLLGMWKRGGLPFGGLNYADLYRVTTRDGLFLLRHAATRQFHCLFDGGDHIRGAHHPMRLCNFAAGSSAYLSPTGELILYALPHDDEDAATSDFVRLAEFRHHAVSRPTSPLRDPEVDRPWVELYDDVDFEDRSIVIDHEDRGRLELHNLRHLDRFDGRASSVRWRAPEGLDIHLYEHRLYSRQGQCLVLRGTGETESLANLHGVSFGAPHVAPCPGSAPRRTFTGRVSSLRFVPSDE